MKEKTKHVCYASIVICSAILIAGYAVIHFSAPKPKEDPIIDPAIIYQIDIIDKEYQSDCNQLLADFLLLLETEIEPDYLKAKTNIPETTEKICGLGTCVKICYKAAKDKLSDTHDFDDAFYSLIEEPIVQPCRHASEIASNELNNLNQRLKERCTKYAVDLATAYDLNQDGQQTIQLDIKIDFGTTIESAFNGQKDRLTTWFISVPLEIVFFKGTIQAALKLFVVPVARICGASSVGAFSAAADGPLPFGDAIGATITVGGLVWTAYDVYSVTRDLPELLKTNLANEIDTAKAELVKNAKEKALELTREYRQLGNELKDELIKKNFSSNKGNTI